MCTLKFLGRTDGRTDETPYDRLVGNSLAFDRLYARLPAHERNGHKGKSSGYVLNKNSSWLKREEDWNIDFGNMFFYVQKISKMALWAPGHDGWGLKCLLLLPYEKKRSLPIIETAASCCYFFFFKGKLYTEIHVLIAATR